MSPEMNRIVEAVSGEREDCHSNAWNGIVIPLTDGVLRIAQEGGGGEDIQMFRLDRRVMLEWQASFSISVPTAVIVSAISTACEEGGA